MIHRAEPHHAPHAVRLRELDVAREVGAELGAGSALLGPRVLRSEPVHEERDENLPGGRAGREREVVVVVVVVSRGGFGRRVGGGFRSLCWMAVKI